MALPEDANLKGKDGKVSQLVAPFSKNVAPLQKSCRTSSVIDLIPAIKKTETWLTVSKAASILGVHERSVQRQCKAGKYTTKLVEGNGGKQYRILLEDLPQEVQDKYHQNNLQNDDLSNVNADNDHDLSINNSFEPENGFDNYIPHGQAIARKPFIGGVSNPTLTSPSVFFEDVTQGQVANPNQNSPQIGGQVLTSIDNYPIPARSFSLLDLTPQELEHRRTKPMPERAKTIGLKRYELVQKFREFRRNYTHSFYTLPNQPLPNSCLIQSTAEETARIIFLLSSEKLSIRQLAEILEEPERTIKFKAEKGIYEADKVKSAGKTGFKYLVWVSSLPIDVQIKYFYANYSKFEAAYKADSADKKPQKPKLTEADKAFEALYNSKFYEDIFNVLGKTSIKTIYRWDKDLKTGGEDYKQLVPAYSYAGTEKLNTTLSIEESSPFMRLLLTPAQMKIERAYEDTKIVLQAKGFTDIKSVNTYRKYANWFKNRYNHIWVGCREGMKALNDKCIPSITRDWSKTKPGELLVADGHKLDFLVIDPFTGKPCRAVLVGFLDAVSNYMAGFEIMLTENTQCALSALRNACLNMGKIPDYVYIDNGKAFKNKFLCGENLSKQSLAEKLKRLDFESGEFTGVYGALGITTLFAKAYNAQTKPIERWFADFSNQFERKMPSFIGNNIENKPAWMMRNEKLHQAMHNEYIPTLNEAIELIATWIDTYHAEQPCPKRPGMTIKEAFNEARGEGLCIDSLNEMMMSAKGASVGRRGIRFLNAYYWNEELFGRKSKDVVIRYSLLDLNSIQVYTFSDEYICTAERIEKVDALAGLKGNELDMATYQRAIKQQAKLKKQATEIIRPILALGKNNDQLPDYINVAKTERVESNKPRQAQRVEGSKPKQIKAKTEAEIEMEVLGCVLDQALVDKYKNY